MSRNQYTHFWRIYVGKNNIRIFGAFLAHFCRENNLRPSSGKFLRVNSADRKVLTFCVSAAMYIVHVPEVQSFADDCKRIQPWQNHRGWHCPWYPPCSLPFSDSSKEFLWFLLLCQFHWTAQTSCTLWDLFPWACLQWRSEVSFLYPVFFSPLLHAEERSILGGHFKIWRIPPPLPQNKSPDPRIQ